MVESQDEFSLGNLLSSCRGYLLSKSKKDLYSTALSRSAAGPPASEQEVVVSRSRSIKFSSRGDCDVDGRWSVFGQCFRVLHGLPPAFFRRTGQLWKVLFAGERAQDAGGPYRELWSTMCQELMSHTLPLMKLSANASSSVGSDRDTWVLNPDANSAEQLQMFEFLGKLMGSAARSGHYMDLYLSPMVWKLIAGEEVGLEDYKSVDSLTVSLLEGLRSAELSEMDFMERFEPAEICFSVTSIGGSSVDLLPGGSRERLTWQNRLQYCDEVERFRLREMAAVTAAVNRGLATQLPPAILRLARGEELERMVCGSPDIDVGLLRAACDYSGYNESDALIRWFWELMSEFSVEDKRAYLRFTWGRTRLPLTLSAFSQRMKITCLSK